MLLKHRQMRARHIGADELDAIEICHGYADAQRKYAAEVAPKTACCNTRPG